ncbi:group II intron maturase-specific domain-containing protein [Alkalihalobacterium bogoriense]|uniref:group II intron maturase-specific domain-containing protein n=1 Tax=Alkalihalobacterium bogoriense TaxID=246272 RepID=UPI001FDF7532|nr:group II intron maturase-specific domain-containing protein [Alkalihalobacterium bogoriense]
MKDRLERLKRYLVCWLGYNQIVDTPKIFRSIGGWIRRRLRMIRWEIKNLTKLGIDKHKAWEWANSSLNIC